jgi:drug/metabolite transporter (DMT)-like permease
VVDKSKKSITKAAKRNTQNELLVMAKGLTERREHGSTTIKDENVSTIESNSQHQQQQLLLQRQDIEAAANKSRTIGNDLSTLSKPASDLDATADDLKPSHDATKTAVLLSLQVANIMLWYWTNGMNGIAMQAYAGQVKTGAEEWSSKPFSRFVATFVITSSVTCSQLLLGALIGRMLLFIMNRQITWAQIFQTSIPLASLHAGGSLATNLGFMYGKASLVQVIKLLEPFETLLLSHLLFREGNFTLGIVSSMILVVGAATSLLKLQSTPPLPQAVIFALLSGLTLSTRNVLQRKHHHTALVAKSWTKLEKSVVQFTQLSFFSALWVAVLSAIVWFFVPVPTVHASWQVYLWHPLYNIFSMITLGFCSALTHSLLNAGKRVFAICMAMLWFSEGLNAATMSGLLAVACGGAWYDWEGKRKIIVSDDSQKEYYKVAVSVSTLVCLFAYQSFMVSEKGF